MVCVACVTGSHTRDGKRKGKRQVCGITVGTETDFATRESFKGTQGRVSARLPSPPDAQGGLANIDVAGTIGPVTVATVDAIAANKPIKARADRFGRGNGFD